MNVYGGIKAKCIHWTSLIVMYFTMHVSFCPEQQQQQQQQTLVTKKTSGSFDPFVSVSNSFQSCKKISRPSPCCKWSNSWLWKGLGTTLHVMHWCKLFSQTQSQQPHFHACPAQLSVAYHSASNQKWGGSLRKRYTVYSLDTLSRKSCIHTQSTRASQQLQLVWAYKFSCKCSLFMPPHCTKHTV